MTDLVSAYKWFGMKIKAYKNHLSVLLRNYSVVEGIHD